MVTNHAYKLNWGQGGLDREMIHIKRSEVWNDTDKPVVLLFNNSAYKERVRVTNTESN